jgi:enoyl-[acyl-carrier protein] reductase II
MIAGALKIPLIAAGGIGTGRGMLAAMNLGADGVQIGSRFVASSESSAHEKFKNRVVEAKEGDTELTLKEITPVRLIKNDFYFQLKEAYSKGATTDELKQLLGRGRAKKGMFEGDMEDGELEIGQISGLIEKVQPAAEIIEEILSEYSKALEEQNTKKFKF